MMWLWWAIPSAYLAVAALTQPRIALDRFGTRDTEFQNERAKRDATREAFGLSLMWPAVLLMMRSSRTIQATIDDQRMREEARQEIEQHNREAAQREADEFDRALNGTDGLPKHAKARNINLDFIGAHIAGTGSYGRNFSGKLESISFGSSRDPLHLRVDGEYKYPDPDTILTINGGTA